MPGAIDARMDGPHGRTGGVASAQRPACPAGCGTEDDTQYELDKSQERARPEHALFLGTKIKRRHGFSPSCESVRASMSLREAIRIWRVRGSRRQSVLRCLGPR